MKKIPGFRISTLSERKEFYKNEFSIKKVKNWFKARKLSIPQLCALDPGSETGIIIKKSLKGNILYFPFNELSKKINEYFPEDLYYDRNQYKNYKKVLKTMNFKGIISQELVFDIDSDNIKCNHPKNQYVCKRCLKESYKWTLKLEELLKKLNFKKIELAYSGRGFHIHVLDKSTFYLSKKERDKLNKKFSRFPIDPWVSRGNIRLIRMPYSLNSLVSRIATPIKIKKRFNTKIGIPRFLKC